MSASLIRGMTEDFANGQTVGRYLLFGQIGAGGMGAVHLGRLIGPAGFSRLVAIKRLHPHLSKEREFVNAFLDEARIAARVSHPNVVSIDDVVIAGNEVLLVMEYVKGPSLSFLASAERKSGRCVPPRIAVAIAVDMLHGLQAAHDARDERGRALGLIHRDVSPQNVLVGVDGVARVLDFGIAKALGRLQTTEEGAVKGKLAYMAPERLSDRESTASVDIYAAAIVIWELLAGERYFEGPSSEALLPIVIDAKYRHLRDPALVAIDAVLERALRREPSERHGSCNELAKDLERLIVPASRSEITPWVQRIAGAEIAESDALISDVERNSMRSPPPPSEASRTVTTRVDTSESDAEAPPTRPEPHRYDDPPPQTQPPPTRPERGSRHHESSTQLTSEATVSGLAGPTNANVGARRSRFWRIVGVAAVIAVAAILVAWGESSRERAGSASTGRPTLVETSWPVQPSEETVPSAPSQTPQRSSSSGDAVGPLATTSATVAGVSTDRPHAKTATPTPSTRPSGSAPPKPTSDPDAPSDRK